MTNTVYVVLIQDKHCDPDVEVFLMAEDAITYARKTAEDYAAHAPESIEERTVRGMLFFMSYSDGDSVQVLEKPLYDSAEWAFDGPQAG